MTDLADAALSSSAGSLSATHPPPSSGSSTTDVLQRSFDTFHALLPPDREDHTIGIEELKLALELFASSSPASVSVVSVDDARPIMDIAAGPQCERLTFSQFHNVYAAANILSHLSPQALSHLRMKDVRGALISAGITPSQAQLDQMMVLGDQYKTFDKQGRIAFPEFLSIYTQSRTNATHVFLHSWFYAGRNSTAMRKPVELSPVQDFLAGTAAGVSLTLVGHPFDTIKVRLQTQTGFKGGLDCLMQTVRNEGVLSLFKGMSSPLCTIPLVNAIVFYSYATAKNFLHKLQTEKKPLSLWEITACGSFAGLVNCLVICPVELIKMRLQVQFEPHLLPQAIHLPNLHLKKALPKPIAAPLAAATSSITSSSSSAPRPIIRPHPLLSPLSSLPAPPVFTGPLDCINRTVQQNGVKGLFRGLSATVYREVPAYGGQFFCYEALKRVLTPPGEKGNKDLHPARLILAGGAAGTFGWLLSYPMDFVKCFARGTRLLLYNGDTIAVEDIVGGETLMGDDSSPRMVTALARGRARMFTITPTEGGASPFTVNGAHILVLVNNVKPHLKRRESRSWMPWAVECYEVGTDNIMRTRTLGPYLTEDEAQDVLDIEMREWRPLEWEISVDVFLSAEVTQATRSVCMLMAAKPVTFVNPLLPGLAHVLEVVLGVVPTAQQIDWAAWYLGVWVTDGDASCERIYHGGRPQDQPGSDQEIMHELCRYELLFGEQVVRHFNECSTVGDPAYFFRFRSGGGFFDQSIAFRLLQQYGLINNKHIPQAWVCDSLEVRRRIFAGIMDGDGHYHLNVYSISAKQRHMAEGYKLLGHSMGIRSSHVGRHVSVDRATGQTYNGWCQRFSGDMWDVVQYIACTYKKCPQPGAADYTVPKRDPRCYGFTITERPVDDYFGFAVQGTNSRFLLEDFIIAHNSQLQSEPYNQPTPWKKHPILLDGGFFDCWRRTVNDLGWRALWRGFGPCLARAFPANAAGFVTYELSLKFLRKYDTT